MQVTFVLNDDVIEHEVPQGDEERYFYWVGFSLIFIDQLAELHPPTWQHGNKTNVRRRRLWSLLNN